MFLDSGCDAMDEGDEAEPFVTDSEGLCLELVPDKEPRFCAGGWLWCRFLSCRCVSSVQQHDFMPERYLSHLADLYVQNADGKQSKNRVSRFHGFLHASLDAPSL